MISLTLRFYGDLKELLLISHDGMPVHRRLPLPTSVKDLIEGCGVPHTEVDLVLVDREPASFSRLVEDGEYISIYPPFSTIELPSGQRLQQPLSGPARFLADVNLGKLAWYLRMAGFDTAYRNNAEDRELLEQMEEEKRILLTRDRKLLMHNAVEHGYLPRSDDPVEQLQEVFGRFHLLRETAPFTRCPHCNGRLRQVAKEDIIDRLEPLTKRHYQTFSQCPDCGQVYWSGSHLRRLDPRIRELLTTG
ncbi:hypothetical protein SAMN06265218_11286 [Fodinibius sediminis]|uniref:Twitching motility protein PilT n=2 Tax=Fodinibius sediminis TaxID=1214077 RepID=A0A521DZC3_9BACT|nr:hypothetical protein SAMN06265218_11286 [Fodinibius sediminis]